MKLLLLLVITFFTQLNSEQPEMVAHDIKAQASSLNVILHNDPIFHNTNTNLNTNYLLSLQQQLIHILSYRHTVKEMAGKQIKDLSEFLGNYAREHALGIILGSAVAAYGGTWLRLIFLHHRIMQPDNWSSWQNKMDLDEMHGISNDILAKELILHIQKKYQSSDKIADFISPIIAFLNDINKEISDLQSFIWIQETIKKIYLSSLFPGYRKSIGTAREKLKRVQFLKNIFSSWMAEYKLNLSTASPSSVGVKSSTKRSIKDLVILQKMRELEYISSKPKLEILNKS